MLRARVYPDRVADLSLAYLHSLLTRAKAAPGLEFETVYAKHEKCDLARPHRFIELVQRVESFAEEYEDSGGGWVKIDGDISIGLMELDRLLTYYENPEKLPPGFDDVGASLASTEDYAHTLVMLDAAWFMDACGNGHVECVPTQSGARTPDLRVLTDDRSFSWHVEVHVAGELVHPVVASLSVDRARYLVDETLRRKKEQLRASDSFLLMGGLGCSEEIVDALKEGAAEVLVEGRRERLAGVHIYSSVLWTEEYRRDDGRVAARLHNGSRTATVENPGYTGSVRLSSALPPDAPLRRMD